MITVHSAELAAQFDRYCKRNTDALPAEYREEEIEQNVREIKLFSKNALYEVASILPHMKGLRSFTANIAGYEEGMPEKTYGDVSLGFPEKIEEIKIAGSTALRALSLLDCPHLRSLSVSACTRLDWITLSKHAEEIQRLDLYGITPQYSHSLLCQVNNLLEDAKYQIISSKIDLSAFLDASNTETKRFFRLADRDERICPVENCSEMIYTISKKDVREVVEQIRNITQKLCTKDMTPSEKLIVLSEYCKEQFKYRDTGRAANHMAAGAVLTGHAVCEGQAKAMALLSHCAGLCVRNLTCMLETEDPLKTGSINAVSDGVWRVEEGRVPYENIPVVVYPDEYYFNRESTATHQMNYFELDDGARCYFDVTNDAAIAKGDREEAMPSFYTKKDLAERTNAEKEKMHGTGIFPSRYLFYREEYAKDEAYIRQEDQKKALKSAQKKFEKARGKALDFSEINFPRKEPVKAWVPETNIRRIYGRDPMRAMQDIVEYHANGHVRGMYLGDRTAVNRDQGILIISNDHLQKLLEERDSDEYAIHSRDGAVILCGDGKNDMMVNDGRNSCRLSEIKRVIVTGTNKNVYLPFENKARVVTRSEHDAMREEVREKVPLESREEEIEH